MGKARASFFVAKTSPCVCVTGGRGGRGRKEREKV